MRAIILGNSIAGLSAALAFRKADKSAELVIVSREPHLPYSRPLITYYLSGKVDEEKMYYRGKDFHKSLDAEMLLGTEVESIDTAGRSVRLSDGRSISFDTLLVAAGGVPFVPPIENLAGREYFTFTTWDDARRVKEIIPRVRNAVVLGGGLIGLKAAEALNTLHVKTTVIELADRLLAPALDTRASGMISSALANAGIDVITQDTVAMVDGPEGKIDKVTLRSGRQLNCDLLIAAVGVVPNTAIVSGTGITTNRGIAVNERMMTNVPGIYAAGDIAEGVDVLMGSNRIIPIWPSAWHQGAVAGSNMAGCDKVFKGHFAMNSVDVHGTSIISLGLSTIETGGEYEILTASDTRRDEYRKIVLKDNVIVGAIFVNSIDRAGIITGLIRDGIDVRNFKEALSRDDFGYISLPRELRKERLEGLGVKL